MHDSYKYTYNDTIYAHRSRVTEVALSALGEIIMAAGTECVFRGFLCSCCDVR